jgi:hypothetical protein
MHIQIENHTYRRQRAFVAKHIRTILSLPHPISVALHAWHAHTAWLRNATAELRMNAQKKPIRVILHAWNVYALRKACTRNALELLVTGKRSGHGVVPASSAGVALTAPNTHGVSVGQIHTDSTDQAARTHHSMAPMLSPDSLIFPRDPWAASRSRIGSHVLLGGGVSSHVLLTGGISTHVLHSSVLRRNYPGNNPPGSYIPGNYNSGSNFPGSDYPGPGSDYPGNYLPGSSAPRFGYRGNERAYRRALMRTLRAWRDWTSHISLCVYALIARRRVASICRALAAWRLVLVKSQLLEEHTSFCTVKIGKRLTAKSVFAAWTFAVAEDGRRVHGSAKRRMRRVLFAVWRLWNLVTKCEWNFCCVLIRCVIFTWRVEWNMLEIHAHLCMELFG